MKIVKLFQPRFAPMVRAGTKLNTIRKIPKRPQDMPQVGWEISLREWTGLPYRSPQRVLKESVIEAVHTCVVSNEGAVVNGNRQPSNLFAQADGFKNFAEMREWFESTHGLPFTGIFIAWKP